jgi:squalene-hopene/tetraprenyl-beta-curcumene cyclase
LLEHQNFDGGWGETDTTYSKPSLAGMGPSVAPLTGIVVTALVKAGLARSTAVTRGIPYLLREQREDGSFSNGNYLHALFPPLLFYRLSLSALVHPSEALGACLSALERESAPRERDEASYVSSGIEAGLHIARDSSQ